jgi:hypothetical protein
VRRTFELLLGIATLLPIPIFLTFVTVLITGSSRDGEFPLLPALLMLAWTVVNFVPAIILALDANQHDEPSWTVLLVVFGGFLTPVYFWTHRWPRVKS